MLVDHEIKKLLDANVVTHYLEENIQPVSLDVRLSNSFSRIKLFKHKSFIDPYSESMLDLFEKIDINCGEKYQLNPGDSVLGSTIEYVKIPKDIVCEVHGKSSLGRLFLIVHATAALVDPGFEGHITLEIVNHSPCSILLTPNMPIAQLTFEIVERCDNSYSGKYQKQGHAVPSMYHLNKKLS